MPGCETEQMNRGNIAIVYPDRSGKIFLPKGVSGKRNKVILKAVHRNSDAIIYWYLDENYIGSTRLFHQIAIAPPPGDYILTLSDGNGEYISRKLSIIKPEPEFSDN
jgi:penicillin-binding protein 1C